MPVATPPNAAAAPVPKRAGAELPFDEIWLVDFEFVAGDGDVPRPVCMVALELRSGREIRMWERRAGQAPRGPLRHRTPLGHGRLLRLRRDGLLRGAGLEAPRQHHRSLRGVPGRDERPDAPDGAGAARRAGLLRPRRDVGGRQGEHARADHGRGPVDGKGEGGDPRLLRRGRAGAGAASGRHGAPHRRRPYPSRTGGPARPLHGLRRRDGTCRHPRRHGDLPGPAGAVDGHPGRAHRRCRQRVRRLRGSELQGRALRRLAGAERDPVAEAGKRGAGAR